MYKEALRKVTNKTTTNYLRVKGGGRKTPLVPPPPSPPPPPGRCNTTVSAEEEAKYYGEIVNRDQIHMVS